MRSTTPFAGAFISAKSAGPQPEGRARSGPFTRGDLQSYSPKIAVRLRACGHGTWQRDALVADVLCSTTAAWRALRAMSLAVGGMDEHAGKGLFPRDMCFS
jgi:hypothetical protein